MSRLPYRLMGVEVAQAGVAALPVMRDLVGRTGVPFVARARAHPAPDHARRGGTANRASNAPWA